MNPNLKAKLTKTPIFHSHSNIFNFQVNYIDIDALRWFIHQSIHPTITKKHGMKVKFKDRADFDAFTAAHPLLKVVIVD